MKRRNSLNNRAFNVFVPILCDSEFSRVFTLMKVYDK